jgi:hypothetical protein
MWLGCVCWLLLWRICSFRRDLFSREIEVARLGRNAEVVRMESIYDIMSSRILSESSSLTWVEHTSVGSE